MRDVTVGSIGKHIRDMAIPTVGGGLAFALFNITDTYFIGKLGTDSLAAMGFTFPVVMIASSISMGVSTGASSVLSRLAGRKDKEQMQRIATDGIFLSLIIVSFFAILGLLTMDLLFPLLGADATTLPLVKEYMTVWYACVIVVLTPPVSDGAMRALGDTFRPFIVMLVCAVLNIILDPIFIFGMFGMPAMGIQGAAIATVLSRFVGMIVTLSFLHFRYGLLTFKRPHIKEITHSWKEILGVGVPSAGVSLIPQLLRTFLTALAASVGGNIAVAAIAVGSRIEGFINIGSFAVGGSIIPIIGQNWGSKKFERVEETRTMLNRLAVTITAMIIVAMFFFVEQLAGIFTSDPEVISAAAVYLRIMLFGAIGLNLYGWNGQILNAIGQSLTTLKVNAAGTFFVIMPLVYIGSMVSFTMLIGGLALGQIIVGIAAIGVAKKVLAREEERYV